MSTRANIIIKDKYDKLIFYRHSDGYPEVCGKSLNVFVKWLKDGKIRDNLEQCAGWLILLGAMEYKTLPPEAFKKEEEHDYSINTIPGDSGYYDFWKCGAYEPTTEIHEDIEYLYVIDLETKKLHIDGQEGFEYEEISRELQTA